MRAMGVMEAMRAMRAKSRSRRRWYDPMVVTAMARDGKYGCWQGEAQSSQGYVDGGIACSRRVGLLVAANQKLLVRHFADFPLITLERTVSNQAHNHSQTRKNDQSQPNTNRRILYTPRVSQSNKPRKKAFTHASEATTTMGRFFFFSQTSTSHSRSSPSSLPPSPPSSPLLSLPPTFPNPTPSLSLPFSLPPLLPNALLVPSLRRELFHSHHQKENTHQLHPTSSFSSSPLSPSPSPSLSPSPPLSLPPSLVLTYHHRLGRSESWSWEEEEALSEPPQPTQQTPTQKPAKPTDS